MGFGDYLEGREMSDNQVGQLIDAAIAHWPDMTPALMLADHLEEVGHSQAEIVRREAMKKPRNVSGWVAPTIYVVPAAVLFLENEHGRRHNINRRSNPTRN